MAKFYYQQGDQTVGPVSGIELREAALAGKVDTATLVATDPSGKWVPASQVNSLFDDDGQPLPHPPQTQSFIDTAYHAAIGSGPNDTKRDAARVEELLDRWEDLHEQGQQTALTELCRDCPDLLRQLRERVARLKGVDELRETNLNCRTTRLSPLAMPEKLGRYELQELIGEGGFGQVWKGFDPELHRVVAIKVLRPELHYSDAEVARFLDEAKKVAKLRHANIVSVHDVGQDGRFAYIVSDFMEGSDLYQQMRRREFSPDETIRIVVKIALALHHAHENGVIHRDVKPQNVLLDQFREPFVTDFGIAVTEVELQEGLSDIVGTPAYMSPEQAGVSRAAVDARSDVYSLGVMLYQILVGRLPFQANTMLMFRRAMRTQRIQRPRAVNPNVPVDMDHVCMRALASDPDARWATAKEFADKLLEVLNPPPPRTGDRQAVKVKPTRRHVPKSHRRTRKSQPYMKAASVLLGGIVGIVAGGLILKYHFGIDLLDAQRRDSSASQISSGIAAAVTTPQPMATSDKDAPGPAAAMESPAVRTGATAEPLPAEPLPAEPSATAESENQRNPEPVPAAVQVNEAAPSGTLTASKSEIVDDTIEATPTPRPVERAKVDPSELPKRIRNSIGMELVLISPGSFMMGSPSSEGYREQDEHPHQVRITRPFFVGVHEVTQTQYSRVMPRNPSRFSGGRFPVESVTWNEAVRFCDKLPRLPGEEDEGRSYRLPTEAEWEYACRAGTTGQFNEPRPQIATWFADCSGERPIDACPIYLRVSEEAAIEALKSAGGRVFTVQSGAVARLTVIGVDGFDDSDLSFVRALPQLETVFLSRTDITDAGMVYLRQLSNLRMLVISNAPITNKGIAEIAGLTNLENLDVSRTQVSDQGLKELGGLQNLKWLSLPGTKVTDEGIARLKNFPKLERLGLGLRGEVTDEGLRHLRSWPT